jgi:hypothetical protein
VPVIAACIIEPIWDQVADLLPAHRDEHPLGCHRPRIPDRVVFDNLAHVSVFGCADDRIADATVSATTVRRRRDEWIALGRMTRLGMLGRDAYDHLIGLELEDIAVDGCITKAPGGGEVAGRSPVDRGRSGCTRSIVVDAHGIPLGVVAAPANRHDSPLLEATLDTLDGLGQVPERVTVHLDRGYDAGITRERLAARGCRGRSPPRANRPRWRPHSGGPWSGPPGG